jgi:uncharacterized membrane protein (DUF485 family)
MLAGALVDAPSDGHVAGLARGGSRMEIESSRPSRPSASAGDDLRTTGPPVEDVAYWEGLEHTDEFRRLVAARMRFVLPATAFFLVYYFLLPLLNGLAPGFMRTDVIGHVNIAYLFALSQFFVAWLLAWFYIRRANSLFDRLAAAVRDRAARGRRTAE